MSEFRVVLDGLELDEHEHAAVAQAVLEAGIKAVSGLRRARELPDFVAVTAPPTFIEDWHIYGGWVFKERYALKARDVLQEQGILPSELGGPVHRG